MMMGFSTFDEDRISTRPDPELTVRERQVLDALYRLRRATAGGLIAEIPDRGALEHLSRTFFGSSVEAAAVTATSRRPPTIPGMPGSSRSGWTATWRARTGRPRSSSRARSAPIAPRPPAGSRPSSSSAGSRRSSSCATGPSRACARTGRSRTSRSGAWAITGRSARAPTWARTHASTRTSSDTPPERSSGASSPIKDFARRSVTVHLVGAHRFEWADTTL